ncbi:MAG: YcxB family protein [Candidatus Onthoplasma sp.]
MFSGKVKFNEQMQKELTCRSYVFSILFTVMGAIGTLIYIAIGTIFEDVGSWFEVLLFFPGIMAIGIILLVFHNKMIKKIKKTDTQNNYDFFEDHFIISTIRNGENIGSVKLYYSELTKIIESQNYLFLFKGNALAYPVEKQGFESNKKLLLAILAKLNVKNAKKLLEKDN